MLHVYNYSSEESYRLFLLITAFNIFSTNPSHQDCSSEKETAHSEVIKDVDHWKPGTDYRIQHIVLSCQLGLESSTSSQGMVRYPGAQDRDWLTYSWINCFSMRGQHNDRLETKIAEEGFASSDVLRSRPRLHSFQRLQDSAQAQ